PLGQSVVLIGPNNAGKTSALQALCLWQTGLQEWLGRRSQGSKADTRTGVTINRRAITHTPVSDSRSFWRDLQVTRSGQRVFIDIIVEGEFQGRNWNCGLEFYHANSESLYCRPLRLEDGDSPKRMDVPKEAGNVRLAMLPPMSGLASEEPEVQTGRIAVLLGEGRTAEVLRNLCSQVYLSSPEAWATVQASMQQLFGAKIGIPQRDTIRGSVELSYTEGETKLDLSSAGRGLQQTLLLLAHLHANSGSVLLLDEPDAHLEILRQRQIYSLLTETAARVGSQVIVASHSEVILNEAADKHVVVAFVGKPHRIDDRGSQVLKSLKDIGFEHYYQAETKGFVLYLEGATDLAIMRGFAKILNHPVLDVLDSVFVHYVLNQPKLAEHHFYGLREAKPDLVCVAVFDKLPGGLPNGFVLPSNVWSKREIENYFCTQSVLLRYAEGMEPENLLTHALRSQRRGAMLAAIEEVEQALNVLGKDPWSPDFKVSDEFLPILFKNYFSKLNMDNRLDKSDFYILTEFVSENEIDPDIIDTLDLIARHAATAKPRRN
ncbi:MAG: AAA family ATPase, partial [Bosea sp. (in: a-proteobacteria)]